MNQLKTKLIATSFLVCLCAPPALAQAKVITLDQSQLFIAPNDQVQRFTQSINLAKGQEKLQLTLTYYNGTATQPGFRWLRISSSSMNYLTEKQFGGQKSLSVDVTGDLSWGGNQMIVEGEGPKGASFGWRLTTPPPTILSVYPMKAEPGGTITLTGTNLAADPSGNNITIGGKAAQCISATSKSIVVKVPDDLKTGDVNADVKIGGIDAGAIAFGIDAVPRLTSLSSGYVPPGNQLTIYGDNLSAIANAVKVTIGPFPCQIVSATTRSITVVAPVDFAGNPWGVNQPVKVWINGALAGNRLTVNVYNPIGNQ